MMKCLGECLAVIRAERRKALCAGARQCLYIALFFIAVFLLRLVAMKFGFRTFDEHMAVENMQIVMLALSALCFAVSAGLFRNFRELCLLLCGLCCLAVFRELDKFFDALLPLVSWKIGFIFVVLPLAYACRRLPQFIRQVMALCRMPAFAMMACAFMVVIPMAQLIGHKAFLVLVLQVEHYGVVKQLIEESVEYLGYCMLFCSSIEAMFNFRDETRRAAE